MKLLLSILVLIVLSVGIFAQTPNKPVAANAAVTSPTAKPAAEISSEDKLKFSRLQFDQAKRVVRMQELKTEFDKTSAEQQAIVKQMSDWIQDQVKKLNIDTKLYDFDFDQLKFVEKPKEIAKP